MGLIDVHNHVTPLDLPDPPPGCTALDRWPCMTCHSPVSATMMVGHEPFRKLDDRSWSAARRIEDMDRGGVALQVLSPMPQLLSYWLAADEAVRIGDRVHHLIASMIAAKPNRFAGLGTVPLQDVGLAVRELERLRSVFGLTGVEIGSNINGLLPGDETLLPFFEAAEALGLAVFVHALHPMLSYGGRRPQQFATLAGFPADVGMAAASLIFSDHVARFPRLRVGLSHGGGTLATMLGRLDRGWELMPDLQSSLNQKPSTAAAQFFFDSNSFDALLIHHLATEIAPGHVFAGTDYPYRLSQGHLGDYIDDCAKGDQGVRHGLRSGAACKFLALPMILAV